MSPAVAVRRDCFNVAVAVCVRDEKLKKRIQKAKNLLEQSVEVCRRPDQCFRFQLDLYDDAEELLAYLGALRWQDGLRCVIVISDQLAGRKDQGPFGVQDLVQEIREQSRDHFFCGLVALNPGLGGRLSDIDRLVDANAFEPGRLKDAVVRTANGLWLKAPPPRGPASEPGAAPAVTVTVAQSEAQLERCLRIRRDVYGLIGYLPDEVTSSPSGIEIDCFDHQAIQFVATLGDGGEAVGALRLVLSSPDVPDSMRLRGRPRALSAHAVWCSALAARAGKYFVDRLNRTTFMPLPILESSDFQQNWRTILGDVDDAAELSRLVVPPQVRGLGLSRLLVRAAIAKAYDLGRKVLLLECIPTHRTMYEKYGFVVMREAAHCRAVYLDQYAIAMRLRLDEQNAAVRLAQQDLDLAGAGTHEFLGSLDLAGGPRS